MTERLTWVSRCLVSVASGNQGRVSRIHWTMVGFEDIFLLLFSLFRLLAVSLSMR